MFVPYPRIPTHLLLDTFCANFTQNKLPAAIRAAADSAVGPPRVARATKRRGEMRFPLLLQFARLCNSPTEIGLREEHTA